MLMLRCIFHCAAQYVKRQYLEFVEKSAFPQNAALRKLLCCSINCLRKPSVNRVFMLYSKYQIREV